MIPINFFLLLLLTPCFFGVERYILIDVFQPEAIAKRYVSVMGVFSASLSGTLKNVPLVYQGDGCRNVSDNISSQIAIVDRGNCSFINKTLIAQQQQAKAIIIINSDDSLIEMSGHSDDITIPSMLIKQSVGNSFVENIPLEINIFEYNRPGFENSSVVLLFVAVIVVMGAAYWSSSEERNISKTRTAGQYAMPHIDEGVTVINEKMAAFGLCFASLGLLILFYFMKKLIYLIFILFILGGSQGLHACSLAMCETLCPISITRPEKSIPYCGKVSILSLTLIFPSFGLSLWWFFVRHQSYSWVLQDIMGISLLFLLQKTVRLPNIKVSSILLVLAFLYDIFWVFISPYIFSSSVMVTVATGGGTGEQIPLLLRLPRFGDDFPGTYSLIGLGDIALPGLLVSYLLRFDYLNRSIQLQWSGAGNCFSSYFTICVVGYATGFIFTYLALILMNGAGQPALLYLVPCTLGVVVLVAYRRGDLEKMWTNPKGYAVVEEDVNISINDGSNDRYH